MNQTKRRRKDEVRLFEWQRDKVKVFAWMIGMCIGAVIGLLFFHFNWIRIIGGFANGIVTGLMLLALINIVRFQAGALQ